MMTKELFFDNLSEIRALRDEQNSDALVDFALLLVSQKPDLSLAKFRACKGVSESIWRPQHVSADRVSRIRPGWY